MNIELHYGSHRIGVIEGAFWSDETGYGVFRPVDSDDVVPRRVREYIAFSEEWHDRLRNSRSHDAAEFDAYRDIHESELWHTVAADGTTCRIAGPSFVAGEVTWRRLLTS